MSDDVKLERQTKQCWKDMIQRCTNPKSQRWHTHGGRGITVCDEWRVYRKFREDMGLKPSDYSIERINNNLGYSKENCKWATPKEQAQNRRPCIHLDGEHSTPYQLASATGITPHSVYKRLKKMPREKALSTTVFWKQALTKSTYDECLRLRELGYSQSQIGKALNLSQSCIWKWLNKRVDLSKLAD